jgi:hypothetical protein
MEYYDRNKLQILILQYSCSILLWNITNPCSSPFFEGAVPWWWCPVDVKMVSQVFSLEKQGQASNSFQFWWIFFLEIGTWYFQKKTKPKLLWLLAWPCSSREKTWFTILIPTGCHTVSLFLVHDVDFWRTRTKFYFTMSRHKELELQVFFRFLVIKLKIWKFGQNPEPELKIQTNIGDFFENYCGTFRF